MSFHLGSLPVLMRPIVVSKLFRGWCVTRRPIADPLAWLSQETPVLRTPVVTDSSPHMYCTLRVAAGQTERKSMRGWGRVKAEVCEGEGNGELANLNLVMTRASALWRLRA